MQDRDQGPIMSMGQDAPPPMDGPPGGGPGSGQQQGRGYKGGGGQGGRMQMQHPASQGAYVHPNSMSMSHAHPNSMSHVVFDPPPHKSRGGDRDRGDRDRGDRDRGDRDRGDRDRDRDREQSSSIPPHIPSPSSDLPFFPLSFVGPEPFGGLPRAPALALDTALDNGQSPSQSDAVHTFRVAALTSTGNIQKGTPGPDLGAVFVYEGSLSPHSVNGPGLQKVVRAFARSSPTCRRGASCTDRVRFLPGSFDHLVWSEGSRICHGDVRESARKGGAGAVNVLWHDDRKGLIVDLVVRQKTLNANGNGNGNGNGNANADENSFSSYEIAAVVAGGAGIGPSDGDRLLIFDVRVSSTGSTSECTAALRDEVQTKAQCNKIKYSRNGRFVVGGGSVQQDGYKLGVVKLWEVGAGAGGNGRSFEQKVSAGSIYAIDIFDPQTDKNNLTNDFTDGCNNTVDLGCPESTLAASGADGLLNLFSLPTMTSTGCPYDLTYPTSTIHSIAFSSPSRCSRVPGKCYCAIGSEGNKVELLEYRHESGNMYEDDRYGNDNGDDWWGRRDGTANGGRWVLRDRIPVSGTTFSLSWCQTKTDDLLVIGVEGSKTQRHLQTFRIMDPES